MLTCFALAELNFRVGGHADKITLFEADGRSEAVKIVGPTFPTCRPALFFV
jgi:hypothetical protein